MRRTLASPIFAISSKRPSAIFAEVLSASMRTARRGERASEGMTATRIQSNGGFHMRVAPLNDLIFNRITIQSDRSMAAGGLLRPGTVCRSSCYTFLPRLRPIRSSAVRFAADLYGAFSVKRLFLGFAHSSLFGAGKAVLRPVACDQFP